MKLLVAELNPGKTMLQDARKKVVKPSRRRSLVDYLRDRYLAVSTTGCTWYLSIQEPPESVDGIASKDSGDCTEPCTLRAP